MLSRSITRRPSSLISPVLPDETMQVSNALRVALLAPARVAGRLLARLRVAFLAHLRLAGRLLALARLLGLAVLRRLLLAISLAALVADATVFLRALGLGARGSRDRRGADGRRGRRLRVGLGRRHDRRRGGRLRSRRGRLERRGRLRLSGRRRLLPGEEDERENPNEHEAARADEDDGGRAPLLRRLPDDRDLRHRVLCGRRRERLGRRRRELVAQRRERIGRRHRRTVAVGQRGARGRDERILLERGPLLLRRVGEEVDVAPVLLRCGERRRAPW